MISDLESIFIAHNPSRDIYHSHTYFTLSTGVLFALFFCEVKRLSLLLSVFVCAVSVFIVHKSKIKHQDLVLRTRVFSKRINSFTHTIKLRPQ